MMLTGNAGDFNGDLIDDLVVAVPGQDVGLANNAGAIQILYGTAEGVSATEENFQFLHQDQPEVQGTAEAGDRFGHTFVIGNFDGDEYDDLAVGVPREDVGSRKDAGIVQVFYGSANGLSGQRDEIWHQNTPGVKQSARSHRQFGQVLAAGDFNDDGADDLAVGMSQFANQVQVLYGRPGVGITSHDQIWHQDSPGVQGSLEWEDRFGASLAAGDFDNDNVDDLAIGAPGEAVCRYCANEGVVHVLYGVRGDYLTAAGDQLFSQHDTGRGSSEYNDEFGASLAAGDFDGDGRVDDLAIGAPGEDIGSKDAAGAVNVVYGSSSGLKFSNSQIFHQNTSGIRGTADSGDRFGYSLATADFDGDGRDDLAIGAAYEDIDGRSNAGAVHVLYSGSNGRISTADHLFHQNSNGVLGKAESSDRFGSSLLTGDFNNDDVADLAVTVRGEDGIGAVNVLYGKLDGGLDRQGNQLWRPNNADIKVKITPNGRLSIIGTSGADDVQVLGSASHVRVETWGVPIFEDASFGELADQYFSGKAGNDVFETAINVPLKAYGGAGKDTLRGTAAADQLFGDEGNDWLDAFAGNDRVTGGDGDDEIYGGAGDDRLDGGKGADEIFGEDGIDFLIGGLGNDDLDGGGQAEDILVENAGDLIPILDGDVLHVTGSDGVFQLKASNGWNTTASGYRADGVVTLLTGTVFGNIPLGYNKHITTDSNGVINGLAIDAADFGSFSLEDWLNGLLHKVDDGLSVFLDQTFSFGLRSGEELQTLLDSSDATGISTPVKLGQPYLYLSVGSPVLSYGGFPITPSEGTDFVLIIDPTDPYVFVRVNDTAFGVSEQGKIPFIPKAEPTSWSGSIDGNLYFQTTVPGSSTPDDPQTELRAGLNIDGSVVVDLDADDNGDGLGFSDIYGAFTGREGVENLWDTIKNDVSVGVNGRLGVGVALTDDLDLTVPLAGASALYDSQLKEIHLQGKSEDPFAGTVLERIPFLDGDNVNFQFGGSLTGLDTSSPQFVFDASANFFNNGVSVHLDNSGASVAGSYEVLGQRARFRGEIERNGNFELTASADADKDIDILGVIDVGFYVDFDFRLAGNVNNGTVDLYTRVEVGAHATTDGLFGETYGVRGKVYFSVNAGIDGSIPNYAGVSLGGSLTVYYGVGSSTVRGSLSLKISDDGIKLTLPGEIGTKTISW